MSFEKAVIDSKKLTAKPTNDELLELYSLYKVASGEDFEKADKPGMFDLKGKAKYSAWSAKVKDGLTVEKAKEDYVKLVEALKEKYGYDPNKEEEAVGGK